MQSSDTGWEGNSIIHSVNNKQFSNTTQTKCNIVEQITAFYKTVYKQNPNFTTEFTEEIRHFIIRFIDHQYPKMRYRNILNIKIETIKEIRKRME
jgi:hypothetical protein